MYGHIMEHLTLSRRIHAEFFSNNKINFLFFFTTVHGKTDISTYEYTAKICRPPNCDRNREHIGIPRTPIPRPRCVLDTTYIGRCPAATCTFPASRLQTSSARVETQ